MPGIGGGLGPGFTLTANLHSVLGPANAGYLEITLCGFGPLLPSINGQNEMLSDAGIPQVVGPGPTITATIWGNDQIVPASTFYCIAVMDDKKNIVQAANYRLAGSGNNLAQLVPILPPYGFPIGDLTYIQCTGTVPGNTYQAPGPIIAVTYNGMVIPEGTSGLSWSRAGNNQIVLNFMTQPGDLIYAFVIL